MPMYPDPEFIAYKGRSYTNLEVSEGNAPAGYFIPSSSEAVKFVYSFGPEVGRNVVIPKGKIVAFAGREWDAETSYYRPALKIAGATDVPAGVAPHNVYQRRRDAFSDSDTYFLTRQYIQVPFVASATSLADAKTKADAVKFGCAYNYAAGGTNDAANNMLGKYVVADASGNYITPVDATALTAAVQAGRIVGQVLDIDNTLPPEGWLQFAFGLERSELANMITTNSRIPSPGVNGSIGNFDWGLFPLGTSYQDAINKLRDWNKGLPFLTDGYFRARQAITGITLDNVKPSTMDATDATDPLASGTDWGSTDVQLNAVASVGKVGDVTIEDGCVTVTDPRGAALFITLKYDIANDGLASGDNVANYPELGGVAAGVKVKLRTVDTSATPDEFADAEVDSYNVKIDWDHKMIVVYFTSAVAKSKVIVDATCVVDKVAGLPTMQDFQNCFGIARILLMR